jgi:hypothetical protein
VKISKFIFYVKSECLRRKRRDKKIRSVWRGSGICQSVYLENFKGYNYPEYIPVGL